jgi:PAS domain-containing protein
VTGLKISNICERVAPITKASSIQQGIDAILRTNSNFLPVIDENSRYLGVITLEGLLMADKEANADLSVATCMETGIPTIASDSDFGDVPVAVERFVVTDTDDKVVGVVTPAQLVKSLLDYFFELERMVQRTTIDTKPSSRFNLIKGLITELEAIINSSYDGIFITDGNGVVLRLNKAYERITGVRSTEVIGRNMGDLVKGGAL